MAHNQSLSGQPYVIAKRAIDLDNSEIELGDEESEEDSGVIKPSMAAPKVTVKQAEG